MTNKIEFSEQPDGQPVNLSKGGDAQGTQPEPTGLTLDEVRRIVKEETDAALRKAQSLTDKAEARVMSKIAPAATPESQASPAAQEAAEAEQPPAQAQAPQASETVQPSKEGVPASKGKEGEIITQTAWKIMESMGVEITTEDQEAGMLDRTSGTAFLASLVTAIQAKAARLNAPPPTATTPMGSGAPVPIDYTKMDPLEIFSRAYQKKS